MTVITEFWGKLFGYTGKIWTNWYWRSAFKGVLTLAYMRNKMNRENLFSTYPSNKKVGFIDSPEEIPPFVKFYRTANGSWTADKHLIHCGQAIDYSISGYPKYEAYWKRETIGKLAYHSFQLL